MKIKSIRVIIEGNDKPIDIPFEVFAVHVHRCMHDSALWDEDTCKDIPEVLEEGLYGGSQIKELSDGKRI